MTLPSSAPAFLKSANKKAGRKPRNKGTGGAKMKVKTYCINEGTASQYYGLKNAESGQVLYAAPNNWKTEKGAQRWAEKHGYEVIKY